MSLKVKQPRGASDSIPSEVCPNAARLLLRRLVFAKPGARGRYVPLFVRHDGHVRVRRTDCSTLHDDVPVCCFSQRLLFSHHSLRCVQGFRIGSCEEQDCASKLRSCHAVKQGTYNILPRYFHGVFSPRSSSVAVPMAWLLLVWSENDEEIPLSFLLAMGLYGTAIRSLTRARSQLIQTIQTRHVHHTIFDIHVDRIRG
jgi:hypothetical protein